MVLKLKILKIIIPTVLLHSVGYHGSKILSSSVPITYSTVRTEKCCQNILQLNISYRLTCGTSAQLILPLIVEQSLNTLLHFTGSLTLTLV